MASLKNYYQKLYACPIVELSGYASAFQLKGRIFAYLNFDGPTGTGKDALAEGMLALAVERGDLKKGQTVVEASAGSFATALTIAGRQSGHPVVLAVPSGISTQRQKQLEDLGARLVFSSSTQGRSALEELARKTARECGGYFIDFFSNDDNPEYHRRVTGPAILNNCPGLDTIVAGVGSGGTITGVGEYVRAWENQIRMVAVEPYESQAIGGGFPGRHQIPGLGAGFVPENYNPYVVDRVMAVTSADAAQAARQVLRTDAVPASASAGAALCAARRLVEEGRAGQVLCVFCGRALYE